MQRLTRGTVPDASAVEKLVLAIHNLSLKELKEQLSQNNCNTHGKEELLKDRFLRFNKRVIGFSDVIWHEILDADRVSPKDIENYVKSLDPQNIVSKLIKFHCNPQGNVRILQDRLTRFFLKTTNYETRWKTEDFAAKPTISDQSAEMKGKNSKN